VDSISATEFSRLKTGILSAVFLPEVESLSWRGAKSKYVKISISEYIHFFLSTNPQSSLLLFLLCKSGYIEMKINPKHELCTFKNNWKRYFQASLVNPCLNMHYPTGLEIIFSWCHGSVRLTK